MIWYHKPMFRSHQSLSLSESKCIKSSLSLFIDKNILQSIIHILQVIYHYINFCIFCTYVKFSIEIKIKLNEYELQI